MGRTGSTSPATWVCVWRACLCCATRPLLTAFGRPPAANAAAPKMGAWDQAISWHSWFALGRQCSSFYCSGGKFFARLVENSLEAQERNIQ